MPIPEDESIWENLNIMFATKKGTVRRNKLSSFTEVRANGKIAMKFEGEDSDDKLVNVKVCSDNQNVMLATKNGKCINFPVDEIRVFASRASTGVRGIKLQDGDEVISMTILDRCEVDTDTRMAYLKKSKEKIGAIEEDIVEPDESYNITEISDELFNSMKEKEQFILTISNKGFGKKTSSYEYRVTHRGGSGITNIKLGKKSSEVVAAFPILEHQQIILVTDAGKLIRIPTNSIRVAGRMTQGVTLFKVAEDEGVVSVAVIDIDEEEKIDNIETTDNNEEFVQNNKPIEQNLNNTNTIEESLNKEELENSEDTQKKDSKDKNVKITEKDNSSSDLFDLFG